ncbi:putative secreted protein [Serinicoccus hydrothermalis]|uniref:Putative secreted protein n=1 Tax=Serinicoccus hydrothermalis TaxID=1758689 RepID=A0A1B1NFY7_9MICO|nr:DUF4245 family protein [Serinicoccus hydrothermalis]ANS80342.1 putative secreted protein [Serinicoccus hydrothermalis]
MSERPHPSAGPAAPTPAPDRRRQRLASYTVRNMVYSTLLVLALVLVWWSLTYNPSEPEPRRVEVASTATYAQEQADWPVWVPEPDDAWSPTVVWFEPLEDVTTWHVSYVTPQGEYLAIHQADDVTQAWRDAVLAGGQRTGEAVLPGPDGEQQWQTWQAESGNAQNAWVLETQDAGTVIVHGTAQEDEARALLETVQARD